MIFTENAGQQQKQAKTGVCVLTLRPVMHEAGAVSIYFFVARNNVRFSFVFFDLVRRFRRYCTIVSAKVK